MMELYDEGKSLADRMEYFDGMFTIMSRREEEDGGVSGDVSGDEVGQ